MPFSSLTDPVELARAVAAVDAAWKEISAANPDVGELERVKLSYIVASLVTTAADEVDLARRALERYRKSP